MRTEISTIGKEASILKLFEGTGFKNERTPHLSEKGEVVTSHRIMLEGVDFDLVYTPLKHLGYKAALYAMGDVFAALRQPVALSVQLGLSSRFCYEDVEEFWAGVLAAAKEHDLKHLSLDLNPSVNGLCISLSASGVQRKAVVEQIPEPKNMDLICLTGRLGAAYMGLHILEREKVSFNKNGAQPDLSKYKGKEVTRYTFAVTNYPNYKGTVMANVILWRNRVIGGDLCSSDVTGFIHGFEKPEKGK